MKKYRILILCFLCFLLLASCSLGGNNASSANLAARAGASATPFTPTPLPSPAPENLPGLLAAEQLLLATPHPTRDLYSLAQRLKLHTAAPIPRGGRTTPLNAHVGQEDSFWFFAADANKYERIHARLLYITPHLYMYVEDGQNVNLSAIASSASVFETKIYPTDRATFGSEWTPGIDDDVHLTVLNLAGLGTNTGGYFSANDEYPTTANPFSNEREMFYINLDGLIPGSTDYNSALAQEFQHMINWYQRPNDQAWIDEGMSTLAEQLNGYAVDSLDASFLQAPDIPLTIWSDDTATYLAHYGASYLFLDYFATHYGGYSILKQLLQDPAPPPQNFNDVLVKNGYTDTFTDVLHRWFIANYVQDATIDRGVYGYSNLSLPALTAQHTPSSFPLVENDTVSQYGAEYYVLPSAHRGALTITLQGTPVVRMIDNVPFDAANEWWSNQYDNMDTTLTRGFDLTHVKGKHATLQFAAWFDLAAGNYTFVEASTDGKNWTALKGRSTTSSNLNWGSGYTGTSGSLPIPQWVQESVDLSRYAGKRIWIRFETVTGQTGAHQGFALDAIRVPEIHFTDNAATDNGWVSSGFIRSNNVLPEHFDIQALLYHGAQFSVSDMPVDLASGLGKLTIPAYGTNITRVVLIISAYAAQTTLPASYQLTITSL